MRNDQKINLAGFKRLHNFSSIDITKGETPLWRGDNYEQNGTPFLRSENLVPGGLDLSNLVFISEKVNERMNRSKIYPNDILIAIVGATIGQTGLATKEYREYNTNQAIAIIRPKNNKVAAYLSLILETKFCQLQLERLKGGGARDNLDLHEVKVIKIPDANNKILDYCNKVTSEIQKLKEDSKKYYQQAEELLLKELGLEDFEAEKKLFSIIKLSDCQKANRIDAEYFQPKYQNLISKIQKNKFKKFSEIIENVSAKFNPYRESEKEFNYVELANINSSIGIIDGAEKILGKDAPSRAKRILKENDVIVSSVEGSLEKIALVDKNQENYLASTGFFQFRSKNILPEVLLVLARSIVFQYQLQQRCAGTILTAVQQDSIKDILIPILPKTIQQKIADLIRKSHLARKKTGMLLQEAKERVEKIIEGENRAKNFTL